MRRILCLLGFHKWDKYDFNQHHTLILQPKPWICLRCGRATEGGGVMMSIIGWCVVLGGLFLLTGPAGLLIAVGLLLVVWGSD